MEEKNQELLGKIHRTSIVTLGVSESALSNLVCQGEQLQNCENILENTDRALSASEKLITGMSGFTGKIKSWFVKDKSRHSLPLRSTKPTKKYVPPDSLAQLTSKSQKTEDQQLDQIMQCVRNLELSARCIKDELTSQENTITNLKAKTHSVDSNINYQNGKMKALS